MQRIIITIVLILVGNVALFSQEISKDIFGKWKLKVVEAAGEKATPQEVFGISEAYQVYEKPNKFTGFLGEKVQGTFKVKGKEIEITINKETAKLKVKSFNVTTMQIQIEEPEAPGGYITLHYSKEK
ncbi:hypothetical protein [Tenacibaculum amylolyticum]|uniref:hypothetical protein n=1 Tax=Tenacibaculum amylolyticum TaxID=104269 RepID=UPI003894A130